MFARVYKGRTKAENAKAYEKVLDDTGVKDYLSTEGNRGVLVLRRLLGDEAEWVVVSFWESLDAIKGFVGEDINVAKYYPGDDKYILDMHPNVDHYEVLTKTGDGA